MLARPSLLTRAWLKAKWPLFDALFALGLGRNLLAIKPGAVMVIYHGIDSEGSTRWNSRFLSQSLLETQATWFKKNCQVLDLPSYFRGDFDPKAFHVVLTFDDGYANNLHRAAPLLARHKLPATFFITPFRLAEPARDILWADLIDLATPFVPSRLSIQGKEWVKNRKGTLTDPETGTPLRQTCKNSDWPFIQTVMEALEPYSAFKNDPSLDDYWRLLSAGQIAELSRIPGMRIGAHGARHLSLGKIPLDSAFADMTLSKQLLEQATAQPVEDLAFPDGNYSPEILPLARQAGFTRLLAGDYLFPHSDSDLRNRFGLNPHISWNNQIRALLKGSYY